MAESQQCRSDQVTPIHAASFNGLQWFPLLLRHKTHIRRDPKFCRAHSLTFDSPLAPFFLPFWCFLTQRLILFSPMPGLPIGTSLVSCSQLYLSPSSSLHYPQIIISSKKPHALGFFIAMFLPFHPLGSGTVPTLSRCCQVRLSR